MADFTHSPQGGFATHQHPEYSGAGAVTKFTNLMGAVVSLALVVGVGVWGYKLMVRDVTDIPIVRAAAGEMRVRPEEPGGQLARNQGLSVNSIAEIGASDAPTEEVRLAPGPTTLAEEDQPMPQEEETETRPALVAAQIETAPVAIAADDIAQALESGSVESLVAQLTEGVAPMEAAPETREAVSNTPVLASVQVADVPAVLSGPGLQVSLRPALRPKRSAAVAQPVVAQQTPLEVTAASLPAGTRLVQLGAFDTPDIAREQWSRLSARFAPFMAGKKRIVMEAQSGGRTFYRLRAQGFEDIGDARRFCSALIAENADCIPVVTR